MKEEQLGPLVSSWLKEENRPPSDPTASVGRAMNAVTKTRQLRRWWWLPPFVHRMPEPPSSPHAVDHTTDYQPSPIPASNGHTPTVIGRTSSMLSPVKAITASALVFAIGGAFLIAQPFGQQSSVPGAENSAMTDTVVRYGEDWIVFQWAYPEDGLYLIRPDGTSLHRLDLELGDAITPTWSPDGQRIAFSNPSSSPYGVWVVNADGTDAHVLYECAYPCGEAHYPDWSADGSSIIFSTNEGPSGTFRLMRYDLATDTASEILSRDREPTGEQPRLSPDGTQVAYTRFDDYGTASGTPGSSAIFVADVDGGDERQLTDWELHAAYPDWGPDGTILFTTYDLGMFGGMDVASDLYTIAPDGSELRQLTTLEEGVQRATQPRWTPDGSGIVFTLQEDPSTIPAGAPNKTARRLAWIGADGEGLRYLTPEPVFGTHPEMRPIPEE